MSGQRQDGVYVLYFAQYQLATGRPDELLADETEGGRTAAEWYDLLAARYTFPIERSVVRVAVNGRYAAWDTRVASGDELAFIPPVAGG